ncbi:MAG: metalloregulator ArsR/SmtB family transcription factor [Nitrospinae bacterium]|nr:metalloregulator ArsR/SmtB family transcription factor [Nitrospinota bacterium]
MDDERYKLAAEAMKVIAHPDRLKIIAILRDKEMSVSEIQDSLQMKQSITSQNLTRMKSKGILESRREGNVVYYSIKNREVLKIIGCIESCLI